MDDLVLRMGDKYLKRMQPCDCIFNYWHTSRMIFNVSDKLLTLETLGEDVLNTGLKHLHRKVPGTGKKTHRLLQQVESPNE